MDLMTGCCGAGFSPWILVLAHAKTRRLEPAPLKPLSNYFARKQMGGPDLRAALKFKTRFE
jgi:hypothetical protein